jgi:[histone H3]-lysine4 N-trimethyltransferase ATXR3
VIDDDPYTHNLLSDIMPADLELSPTDKHIFIEEVFDTRLHTPLSISVQALNLPKIFSMQLLLNALNKQVRHGLSCFIIR